MPRFRRVALSVATTVVAALAFALAVAAAGRLRRSPRTSPAFLQRASSRARPRPAGCSSVSTCAASTRARPGTCMPTGGSSGRSGLRPATPRSFPMEREDVTRATSSSGSPSGCATAPEEDPGDRPVRAQTSGSMSAATTRSRDSWPIRADGYRPVLGRTARSGRSCRLATWSLSI